MEILTREEFNARTNDNILAEYNNVFVDFNFTPWINLPNNMVLSQNAIDIAIRNVSIQIQDIVMAENLEITQVEGGGGYAKIFSMINNINEATARQLYDTILHLLNNMGNITLMPNSYHFYWVQQ